MKFLKIALITTILALIPFGKVQAENCQPQYGGGYTTQNCSQPALILNKLVFNPQTSKFVDNMGVSDYKFNPTEAVTFQLNVTNAGTVPFSEVTLIDTLPQQVDYVSSDGSYDSGKQTVTFKLPNLNVGETRVVNLTVKVKSMTVEQGIVCLVNQSSAFANNLTASDNAQFCTQALPNTTVATNGQTFTVVVPGETKGGLKVFPPVATKKTPSTGPESIALFGLIPSLLTGIALRRKTKTI